MFVTLYTANITVCLSHACKEGKIYLWVKALLIGMIILLTSTTTTSITEVNSNTKCLDMIDRWFTAFFVLYTSC